MSNRLKIFVCSPYGDADWRWLAPALSDEPIDFKIFRRQATGWFEKNIHQPDLALMRTCSECVKAMLAESGDVLITLDPRATHWCARQLKKLGTKVPHIAYGFNFAHLPTGLKRRWMTNAFAGVTHFVVYSIFERDLYSKYFNLPIASFEMKQWGVKVPEVGNANRFIPSGITEYVCALGGNRRDYKTLMAAMRLNPEVPCIAVMRDENTRGLEVPPNVTVLTDIRFPEAMGILHQSKFTVLPLEHDQIPCGHVTMVAAMHLGKAIVVTRSAGVTDYVTDGENGRVCEPGSASAMAPVIRSLWEDPAWAARLGENGRAFAEHFCTERSTAVHLMMLLEKLGLLKPAATALT